MISSKKELQFYIMADQMMNRGTFKRSIARRIYELFCPDLVMKFLRVMRKYSYYSTAGGGGGYKCWFYKIRFNKLNFRCGFSIGVNTCGYGLVLHHYGTVIIGSDNRIGNYANILPSCISKSGSTFGDFLFVGYGAIVTRHVEMGDNVKVGANSVVNKSEPDSNIVIVGSPAAVKKHDEATWVEMYSGIDGEWMKRWKKVEELKTQMRL